jgi:hypothetical protein
VESEFAGEMQNRSSYQTEHRREGRGFKVSCQWRQVAQQKLGRNCNNSRRSPPSTPLTESNVPAVFPD